MDQATSLLILLTLAGCSSAHTSDDDAGASNADASADAGFTEDAGSTRDAGVDIGADAGRSGFTSCALEIGARAGDSCFCHGPAVLFGDVLYRQSVGIEVWDVSTPTAPVQVGRVMERAASDGGLGIASGHLISIRNLDAALTIYALDDPTSPRVRSSLPLPGQSPARLVVAGDTAVFIGDTHGGTHDLMGVDIADLDAPVVRWTVPIEGRVSNLAADGDRVYVLTQTEFGSDAWIEARDARTGASEGRHLLAAGPGASSYYAGIAVHRGRVLVGAPGVVRVLELGESLVERGRLEIEDTMIPALTVLGDLVVVGGTQLRIADLSDPSRPRELGRTDVPIGDLAFLMTDGETVFVSNGGGLMSVALACE